MGATYYGMEVGSPITASLPPPVNLIHEVDSSDWNYAHARTISPFLQLTRLTVQLCLYIFIGLHSFTVLRCICTLFPVDRGTSLHSRPSFEIQLPDSTYYSDLFPWSREHHLSFTFIVRRVFTSCYGSWPTYEHWSFNQVFVRGLFRFILSKLLQSREISFGTTQAIHSSILLCSNGY